MFVYKKIKNKQYDDIPEIIDYTQKQIEDVTNKHNGERNSTKS